MEKDKDYFKEAWLNGSVSISGYFVGCDPYRKDGDIGYILSPKPTSTPPGLSEEGEIGTENEEPSNDGS
jgi:hypothetical protein